MVKVKYILNNIQEQHLIYMSKIALCTIAFNEERYIKKFIERWDKLVDKTLVLISLKSWHGNYLSDNTIEEAKKTNAEIITGYWSSESEQRNWGLARLYDYDYVIILDPDEFFSFDDQNKIINSFGDKHAYKPNKMNTYWKDTEHKIWCGNYTPYIAVNPKMVRFIKNRQVQPFDGKTNILEQHDVINVTLEHLSWVRSDDEVKIKINNYSHKKDLIGWYENIWLKNPDCVWPPIEPNQKPDYYKLPFKI